MKGFINLIKPSGMSSAYAVGSVKRKLHSTCGHMGTLDPMADGVLPVGIGQASRLFQYQLDKEKSYLARFIFGQTTDTLDITGVVENTTTVIPTIEQIRAVLGEFIGEIDQIPPKYSAKCIDGKRGYQLARKGIEFELQPKKVCILGFECLSQTAENEFEFKIDCKGGTYIRSLARDLALRLNSLGAMSKLTRTKAGIFTIEKGVTVEQFMDSENPEEYLVAPETTVNFQKAVLTGKQAQKILDGVFENLGFEDGVYRVYNQQEFWGVGESQNGILKIKTYVR